MTFEIFAWVVGSVATLLGAVIMGKRTKTSAEATSGDRAAWEILADMNARLKTAENSINTLNADLGKEREHSAGQDATLKDLQGMFRRVVHELRGAWAWIEGGAKPPPPVRPEWLNNLPGWDDHDT